VKSKSKDVAEYNKS